MIKIFTLLNVAGLFLFNMLFVGEVSIVQDMPAQMEPGTEVRVTVTINKDQISGFAKLQIDLPPGLTASAIETKGASFTFSDGKAKFIWMALPAQPSFKVSYTLSANNDASGTLPVTARLSYIQDNERKTVDMAPATITLGGGVIASTPNSYPTAPSGTKATNDPAEMNGTDIGAGSTAPVADATNGPTDPAATSQAVIAAQSGVGDVSATRAISAVSASEMLVVVTVKKGLLRGFGKLQETLPEGFTAVAKEKDHAIFSTQGRIVKFVWLNLPSKTELSVSYRLLAPASAIGAYTVNGEFGYLMNDLTQRAVVGSTAFNVGAPALATNPPVTTRFTQAPTVTEPPEPPTTPTSTTVPPKVEETVSARSGNTKISSVPVPESGITYKVQITAAHREVGKPYFVQRHHYDGDFSIERNEGWIKYVTGMFDRYNAARERRQSYIDANYNFPGPFVTAYNNGERITVQEAMMIAKQHSAQ